MSTDYTAWIEARAEAYAARLIHTQNEIEERGDCGDPVGARLARARLRRYHERVIEEGLSAMVERHYAELEHDAERVSAIVARNMPRLSRGSTP